MTGQPPQPPPGGYGQQPPPPWGQQPPQPYGQPQQPYGQQQPPPWGQQPPPGPQWGPPPQQPWGTPPQDPYGRPPYGPPGRPGRGTTSVDFSKVGLNEWIIAGCAVLFTLFMVLPWYGFDGEGLDGFDTSTNGFSDAVGGRGLFTFEIGYATGPAVLAWLLLLATAVWVLLPAFTTVRLPVPRTVVTAGLTGLALLLFLITWIDQLGLADGPDDDVGFSVVALLALLSVLAATVLAVLALLLELRARKAAGGAPAAGTAPPQHGQQPYGPPGQQQAAPQPYQPQPYQQPPPPPPPPARPGTPPPVDPGQPDRGV
ncbi:hypothetical protein SAMN05660485_00478 [Blastococcus fimeti]|nr:hypothetical protein SAMN05660485_00478 [Blastococcus fimeti]